MPNYCIDFSNFTICTPAKPWKMKSATYSLEITVFGLLGFTKACTVNYLFTLGWWRHFQACTTKGGVDEEDAFSGADREGVG